MVDALPGRRPAFIIGLEVVASLIVVALLGVGNPVLLIVAIAAYGFFGKLAVEPVIIAWFGRFAPAGNVATTFAALNFFAASSSVVAPAVTGLISDATGSKVSGFYLALAIVAAGTVFFAIVSRRCDGAKK